MIYDTSRIFLSVQCREVFQKIKYSTDNGRRYSTLCTNCNSFNRLKTFDDGNNSLIIRTVGNNNFESDVDDVSFFVDSRDPRIINFEPRNGYATGLFKVKYSEDNLANVSLFIYPYTFTKNDCLSGRNQWCTFNINLSWLEGQEFTYDFRLMDVAGNTVFSRSEFALADTIPVIITNVYSPLNSQTYPSQVPFNITLGEEARYLKYIDYSTSRPSYRTLCSNCDQYGFTRTKKVSLGRGIHNITITSFDRAGNENNRNITFNVV